MAQVGPLVLQVLWAKLALHQRAEGESFAQAGAGVVFCVVVGAAAASIGALVGLLAATLQRRWMAPRGQ